MNTEGLSSLLAIILAGGALMLLTLTMILFALWDIRAELKILNAKRRD